MRRILFIYQTRDRHFDEIRVAHVLSAIRKRAPHRFGHKVITLRGSGIHFLEIVALQNVEHLEQHRASGRWWRHRNDFVATIVAAQCFALFRDIAAHIFQGDQPPMTFQIVNDHPRRLTLIEFVWPALLQTREGRREIGLHKQIAFVIELAVVEIDPFRLRVL